jgi:hypothetical protein
MSLTFDTTGLADGGAYQYTIRAAQVCVRLVLRSHTQS